MFTCFIKGSWFQVPSSFYQFPRFRYQVPPSSMFRVPGFFYYSFKLFQISGFTKFHVPSTIVNLFQIPGSFKFHVLGFKLLILVSRFQIVDTRFLQDSYSGFKVNSANFLILDSRFQQVSCPRFQVPYTSYTWFFFSSYRFQVPYTSYTWFFFSSYRFQVHSNYVKQVSSSFL